MDFFPGRFASSDLNAASLNKSSEDLTVKIWLKTHTQGVKTRMWNILGNTSTFCPYQRYIRLLSDKTYSLFCMFHTISILFDRCLISSRAAFLASHLPLVWLRAASVLRKALNKKPKSEEEISYMTTQWQWVKKQKQQKKKQAVCVDHWILKLYIYKKRYEIATSQIL